MRLKLTFLGTQIHRRLRGLDSKSNQKYILSMVIRVVEFSSGGYKIRKFLALLGKKLKGKFMNFENWCNGELSKIGYHFSNNEI